MKKNVCPFVDECFAEKWNCYWNKMFGKKLPKGERPKCFVSEEQSIMIRAKVRRRGQEQKDNGRWFPGERRSTGPSFTKRERKRLEKLRKKKE